MSKETIHRTQAIADAGFRATRRTLLSLMSSAALTLTGVVPALAVDAKRPPEVTGKTRTYYVAAEEVEWNFAPDGREQMMGGDFNDDQKVFVEKGPSRIGSTYHMARFIGYLDKDFTSKDGSADPSNGILGPIFHAEVGDEIVVNFRNNTRKPVSMHPHGVFYRKNSEGSMTNDGSGASDMADDHVPPGAAHTYHWLVPERAGPGPADPSSVVWLYHSHVDEVRDTNTGLFGAMVITAKGKADATGKPKDVDREIYSMFSVLNQNQNLYLDEMLAKLEKQPGDDDEEFEESNLMHSINGYVFGNMPMPKMKVGENVRWYVMALGTEVDLHTPHWHGNTVLIGGHRQDVTELLPATTIVADMKPDNPGIWMYHCHVNDHIAAGMTGRYEVVDAP
jgi:FtsP/CotA-like multicopper oxidase with cupredoxin domain